MAGMLSLFFSQALAILVAPLLWIVRGITSWILGRRGVVEVELTNFNLSNPGTCGGTRNCGHIHATIDGEACNAPGAPYNTAAGATTFSVDFSLCTDIRGPHTLTVELRRDNHSGLAAPVPMDSVTIMVP